MKKKLSDILIENSLSKYANLISESDFFNKDPQFVTTDVPLINASLSGELDKGFTSGILLIAGESKRFKTLFGLKLIKSFQDKHSDGICIFYDNEFGSPPSYLEKFDLDTKRIIHIPVSTIENLKHDISKQLDKLKELNDPTNKVMIFLDSLGNLPSKKEMEDAVEGSDKADMTRAKQIKSLFRIIRLDIKILEIPMVVINHVYKDQGASNPKYAKDVISGGTGAIYSPDDCWIIKRAQLKDNEEVIGYKFTINIDKSRSVKEKSQFPIIITWNEGIHRFSGLAELAIEYGIVEKVKMEELKGKPVGLKFKDKIVEEENNDMNEEFWGYVIENSDIKEKIIKSFKI